MINITEFYTRYRYTISEIELTAVGARMLRFAETVAHEHYAERYDDFGITISVRLEIGSTRIWVTVKAVGKVLITFGAIRQAADYLVADSKMLAPKLIPGISRELNVGERPLYYQRRFGLPGQFQRLFEQVQRGELSPDEATAKAIRLMQTEDESLTKDISNFREQLSLDFHDVVELLHRNVSQEQLLESGESTPKPVNPARVPSPRERREPVIAALPGSSLRRRRRVGVIVDRDPENQNVRFTPY